nr:ankyrin repeat-containing protein ITN1-like [Ipomoea trifida]
MARRVFEAALEGDVATLKRLLHEDPLVLDKILVSVNCETPLHVAAMLGHHDFANEILRKKPELAKELNSKQSSPLHLAAAKGHADVVRAILLVDLETCKGRDRDGLTPLHLAAIKGRVDVLKELINAISVSGLVDMMGVDYEQLGESILHMCVKHSKLEALKTLVEMIGDGGGDFVNYKDSFGNTILHLAVSDKQIEQRGGGRRLPSSQPPHRRQSLLSSQHRKPHRLLPLLSEEELEVAAVVHRQEELLPLLICCCQALHSSEDGEDEGCYTPTPEVAVHYTVEVLAAGVVRRRGRKRTRWISCFVGDSSCVTVGAVRRRRCWSRPLLPSMGRIAERLRAERRR